ncbi:MAG: hypothetical protein RMY34_09115 [Aulosira sp. DedQUE10]|nr:hypothetical protein [Aulosira sp. DedQUE10]
MLEVRHKKFVFIPTKNLEAEYYHALVVSNLADKLSQIQKTPLFSLWQDTLHVLSLRTRPGLLTDVKALTPVIFTLDGQKVVKYTSDGIQDVSRWWG